MIKKKAAAHKSGYKRTTFSITVPDAESVYVVGDFNSWDTTSHPLKKGSNGLWKRTVNLAPGRYEYRFLVDGRWENDPQCSAHTPNPFGGDNCIITLE